VLDEMFVETTSTAWWVLFEDSSHLWTIIIAESKMPFDELAEISECAIVHD
jgi:hypothetical protein